MIPYSVDASFDHRPVVNWLIFAVVVLAFIVRLQFGVERIEPFAVKGRPEIKQIGRAEETEAERIAAARREMLEEQAEDVELEKIEPEPVVKEGSWIVGLFTYSFLHVNAFHFLVNLIFLWFFGNAICAKTGNKVYPILYLVFSLLGGVIHMLLGRGPGMGTNAAISGFAGMYLVLFPENSVNWFSPFPHPVTFAGSSYTTIIVWLVLDFVSTLCGVEGIAFIGHTQSVTCIAHILVFGVGFGLAALALKKKWLLTERGERSLLQVLSRQDVQVEQEQEKKPKESEARKPTKVTTTPKDEFIHFSCDCGKKIRVHRRFAGKTGQCPQCKKRVKIPAG